LDSSLLSSRRSFKYPVWSSILPIAIETASFRATSARLVIRSRNTTSDAVALGVKRPSSMANTSRAQSDRAELTSCNPAASSGGASSITAVGLIACNESITPLPIPRAGTLMTRRRLTSSCGFMISLR
jgi:hypothetical protein